MSIPLYHSRKLDNDFIEKDKDAFIKKKDSSIKGIAICNYNPGKDLIIFTSEEVIDEYEQAKKISNKSENFDLYLQKQQQGLAMPLLQVKFHKKIKFGGSKFLTINKFMPPPSEEQRLFDKSKDKFEFCTVFKDYCKVYDKYTFKFQPNPRGSSENFETYVYFHRKLGISDIPKTGQTNERLRWARTDGVKSLSYTYTLYILDAGQPSLVDNLDTTYIDIDSQTKFLTFSQEQMSLASPHVLANLIHLSNNRASYSIQRTARIDIKIPEDRRNLESESIHSVTPDELIFITSSVIFKYFEDLGRLSKLSLGNNFGLLTLEGFV